MAKRFTDTELWGKTWFQELSLKHKILYQFLCARCDLAGIWDTNYRLASFIIGEPITETDILKINKDKVRIQKLENGDFYLLDFIEFQYGKLSPACKPHLPIIKRLQQKGIGFELLDENNLSPKQFRKRITEKIKKEIFSRDKYECQYCGNKENLVIDHVKPLSKGGDNEDNNLITACSNCNSNKWDLSLEEYLKKLKEKNTPSNILERVSKILDTLKEKEEEKDTDKDKEKEEENPPQNFSEDPQRINPDEFFTTPIEDLKKKYNEICTNLNKCQCVSNTLRKEIVFRWREHPDIKFWEDLFKQANKVSLESGWRPNFHWIFENDDNYTKILNGNFGGNNGSNKSNNATNGTCKKSGYTLNPDK
jgi:5-methylcytosine-specific restriction endonuclease McrA